MSQNFDYSKLTKEQLKDQLRARGLKLGGNKPELIVRLQAPPVVGVPLGVPAVGAPSVAVPPVAVPAPLPVGIPRGVPVPVAKPKAPKKEPKNPLEVLMGTLREADQTMSVAIAVLLNVYGAGELHPAIMQLVGDRAETLPAPLPVPMTFEGLKDMKVTELKKILKARGEKVGGNKDDLVLRILNPTAQAAQGPVTLPPAPQLPAAPVVMLAPPTATGLNAAPALPTVPGIVAAPALPTVSPIPALPTVSPIPALPTVSPVPALPTMSPTAMITVPALPTVSPVPAVSPAARSPLAGGVALPTVGLPTLPTVGSPTVAEGLPTLPTVGSPNM